MDRSSYRSNTPDNRLVPQTSWELRTASPAGDVIQANKSEEWTTSKKTVNHKTRQIETRVQRQLVLEDGKVIADSGPQVSQRTREDNKVEESEDTNHKTSGEPDLPTGYVKIPGSERVIDDKTTTHHTTRESREENIKMHDEDQRHLDNIDGVHKLALTGNEVALCDPQKFKGKVTHYSARSKRVTDKDRIKELTEHVDGKANTQKTRTHFHEEQSDDEVPEEFAEREGPAYDSSHSRNFEYLNDGKGKFDYLSDKLAKDRTYLQITQGSNRNSSDYRHHDDGYTRPIDNTDSPRASRWLDEHFVEEDRQRVINVDTRSTRDSRDYDFGNYHRVADLRENRDSRYSDHRDSRYSDHRDSRVDQRRHETIYADIRHSTDYHRDLDRGHSPLVTSPHSTLKSVRNEDYRTHTWRSSGVGEEPEMRYTVRSPDSTVSSGSRPSRTFYFGATGHTNETPSVASPLSAPSLVKKSSFNLRGR